MRCKAENLLAAHFVIRQLRDRQIDSVMHLQITQFLQVKYPMETQPVTQRAIALEPELDGPFNKSLIKSTSSSFGHRLKLTCFAFSSRIRILPPLSLLDIAGITENEAADPGYDGIPWTVCCLQCHKVINVVE